MSHSTKPKVLFFSDVRKLSSNGVVTLMNEMLKLADEDMQPVVINTGSYRCIPDIVQEGVPLAYSFWHTDQIMQAIQPKYVHIVTEGPVGLFARAWLGRRNLPYTSAYHTRMELHVNAATGIPVSWTEAYMRWFHRDSQQILVDTPEHLKELQGKGYQNLTFFQIGVDSQRFAPVSVRLAGPRPIAEDYLLYVGRISKEKNIEAFLDIPTKQKKIVVGSGKTLSSLRAKYPDVIFAGRQDGDALVRYYQHAKMLVMPSTSETLGMVMMEAMACGVPVAAFPMLGSNELIECGVNGHISLDLKEAIDKVAAMDPKGCRASISQRTWSKSREVFNRCITSPPAIIWDNGRASVSSS